MTELREFAAIVDRDRHPGAGKPPEEAELRTALQALLLHQAIYAHSRGVGRSFDVLVEHLDFAKKYFDAIGARVEHSARDQMVCLVPSDVAGVYGWRNTRRKLDETLVILALAYVREAAIRDREIIEDGKVASTTDVLVDVIRNQTGKEPPSEARLAEILAFCKRKGMVLLGDHDKVERLREIWILPAVEVIAPSSWAAHIVAHYAGEATEPDDAAGDAAASADDGEWAAGPDEDQRGSEATTDGAAHATRHDPEN